ncbi:multiheme c-type cytochrome [Engelhardtia mirabilis]|uniref:multiheme c-type cytochrome n=1 Tax=Engelhardtia mirabilis TaxID=2528011 RepID=UPI003AF3E4FF
MLLALVLTLASCLVVPRGPVQTAPAAEAGSDLAERSHAELLERDPFPSARQCATCHERHYREWSASPHAYAQISPTYNAYQALLVNATNGTLGDFCVRCHTQVGMTLGEPIAASNAARSEVAVEGITCVVCHRVSTSYGKNSGRFALESGDIFEPIYGPRADDELRRVLGDPATYRRVVTDSDSPGRRIHAEARQMPQIQRSAFCGRCHDVRLVDGFRLEDAFSEYKQSPAAERGESCQDCHMGPIPGVPSRYEDQPAAIIGDQPTAPARRTNHMFAGPDAPLVHPGIFPHNPEAAALASPQEWLQFDYAAGWGTDEFEDAWPDDSEFPERWASADERYDAREVLETQLGLRREAYERGTTLLRNGYRLGEIRDLGAGDGLAFELRVENASDGHSAPTGLIAERLVFLQIVVTNADGEVVFRSGDLDPDGDLRDRHSAWVQAGHMERDEQLFNLRSPFVVRNLHGSEREQIVPANYSFDPLVFVRPSPTPSMLMGGVPGVRIQKRNIEIGGYRVARYSVPAEMLQGAGPYHVRAQLVSGQLPVHLIRAMQSVGFEWGLSGEKLAQELVANYRVLHVREATMDGR